jgi:hypothetical protein
MNIPKNVLELARRPGTRMVKMKCRQGGLARKVRRTAACHSVRIPANSRFATMREFVNKMAGPLEKAAPGGTPIKSLILKGFVDVNKSLISFNTFSFAGGEILLRTFPVEPMKCQTAEEVSAAPANAKINK